MKLSAQAASAAADAVCAQLDGGVLRLYDGDIPATANTPLASQTLLAELAFDSPAFDPAIEGAALGHLSGINDAPASGTATFCLAITSGFDPVFLGTVGLVGSGSDCEMRGTTSIVEHGVVSVASVTYTQPLA